MHLKPLWNLDPKVLHLNHGSFGGCPKVVLQYQQQLRERLEKNPMQFFVEDFYQLLDDSRKRLADFVKADPEGVAFVTNATAGANAVLRSLPFHGGDEIIVTNHGYGACNNTAHFIAERCQARVQIASIPFPVSCDEQIIEPILAQVTANTRLAVVDHVSSPTALVFPIAKIIQELQQIGVDVLVDGAHTPGMLDLDITALNPCYYTGNCHKWMCAPRGAAFLYVREDKREQIFPTVISNGLTQRVDERSLYHHLFDWQGTHDPTAYMSLPCLIDYMASLHSDGWSGIRRINQKKALDALHLISDGLSLAPVPDSEYIGSMFAMVLPQNDKYRCQPGVFMHPLQKILREEYRIEVPIISWEEMLLIRISAHIYNQREEYERLGDVLREVL